MGHGQGQEQEQEQRPTRQHATRDIHRGEPIQDELSNGEEGVHDPVLHPSFLQNRTQSLHTLDRLLLRERGYERACVGNECRGSVCRQQETQAVSCHTQ
jgi:hypothetical protein